MSLATDTDKRCRHCHRHLPASAFRLNPAIKGNLHSWCKDCTRQAVRASRALHQERNNARRRGTLESRGVPRAIRADPLAKAYLATLCKDPCAYCGDTATDLDHIAPRSTGGTDNWDNYTAACRSCNAEKRNVDLLQFLLRTQITAEVVALWDQRLACGPKA